MPTRRSLTKLSFHWLHLPFALGALNRLLLLSTRRSFPRQGLCCCCPCCLESPPSRCQADSHSCFRRRLRHCFLQEALPDYSVQAGCCPASGLPCYSGPPPCRIYQKLLSFSILKSYEISPQGDWFPAPVPLLSSCSACCPFSSLFGQGWFWAKHIYGLCPRRGSSPSFGHRLGTADQWDHGSGLTWCPGMSPRG